MDRKKIMAVGIILAVLAVYHIATNVWFIRADNRPCNINELSHVMGAIDFANLVSEGDDYYADFLQAFSGYPPIGAVTSVAYGVFGRNHNSAQYSQLLFSLLLIAGVFGLGQLLFNTRTAILAVFLCLTAPASCEVSRQYLLEWSLTATTTVAALFLFLSEGFSKRNFALWAGIFVGLSALCKQTFMIFLAGPILYSVWLWLMHLVGRTQLKTADKKYSNSKAALGFVVCFGISFVLASILYTHAHRVAIQNWFANSPANTLPWGAIFLIATGIMLGLGFWLLWIRPTPFRNGVMAAMFAVCIASVWYFPKGLMNFLTYYNQMKMNVEKSHMSPGSLLRFYTEHVKTYYLGPVMLWVLAATVFFIALIFLARPYLKRHFFLRELIPAGRGVFFMLLWLAIPALAFFYINIQNEMNTVPLLPPLYLLVAAIIAHLRLVDTKKTQRLFQQGKIMPMVRISKWGISAVAFVLLLATAVNGFATSWIFPTGTGYEPLPKMFTEQQAKKLMPRKYNNLTYLVPFPENWHEVAITRKIISEAGATMPKILIMDVDFYFSFNTFWYQFKLENYKPEIFSPWYDDKDLLAKDENGVAPIDSYDFILHRQPYEEIYKYAYNDYIDYVNLWKTFAFLANPPEGFYEVYRPLESWKLPGKATAYLLVNQSFKSATSTQGSPAANQIDAGK